MRMSPGDESLVARSHQDHELAPWSDTVCMLSWSKENQREAEDRSALFVVRVASSYRLTLLSPTHQLSEADAYTEPDINYLGDLISFA
jgi:hypothetical protein